MYWNSCRLSKLNAEQKCDIAAREIEELRDEIDKSKEDAEKVVDNHKAVMEEADIALAEIKKAMYEFNRDIVQGAVNDRTKKVMAEKAQRYFEEKIRQRVSHQTNVWKVFGCLYGKFKPKIIL